MKLNSLSAILIGGLLAFSSCDKNESDVVSTSTEEVTSLDFALLATSAVTDSSNTDSTSTKPDGHHSRGGGKNCEITEVETTELPAAITSYVSENYAEATIEHAAKANNGGYVLHVKKSDGTAVGLLFDASGNFVSEKSQREARGTEVAVSDLPATIATYITANYAGATTEKAVKDSAGNYIVLIKKTDGTLTGLAFDGTGAFTSEVNIKGKSGGHKRGRH